MKPAARSAGPFIEPLVLPDLGVLERASEPADPQEGARRYGAVFTKALLPRRRLPAAVLPAGRLSNYPRTKENLVVELV